jgi:hypothetical protein
VVPLQIIPEEEETESEEHIMRAVYLSEAMKIVLNFA